MSLSLPTLISHSNVLFVGNAKGLTHVRRANELSNSGSQLEGAGAKSSDVSGT